MKAVILAGGSRGSAQALTAGRPSAALPLFGKPLLGHVLDLLARHGVTEAAVLLGSSPNAVMDLFGTGGDYGVELTWLAEEPPSGTAGGLRPCRDYLGQEDFLLLPGDGVGDPDLTALLARHRAGGAAATLALCRRADREGPGLRRDPAGRVLGLDGLSPLAGEAAFSGIWALRPGCLDELPSQSLRDLGRELLPALLDRGAPVLAHEVAGSWYTLDHGGAYLDCVRDALGGKLTLDLDTGRAAPPAGVEVKAPCWVGRRTSLAPGCTLGPYTVIGEGSTVETGAVVERSVLLGAGVGEGAEVTGAVLCQGASVRRRGVVCPGAVLGERSSVGADAIVAPGVKLWPGRTVPEGGRATASQVSSSPVPLTFSESGALRGTIGEELTPETLLALGSLLGEQGAVGLGWSGGSGAAMLGRAAFCGVAAAGGQALVGDAPCPSAQSWLGRHYSLPVSLFVRQDGDGAELRLFDSEGMPLDRARQRKLEGALLRGEGSRVPAVRIGAGETVCGVRSGYAGEAARLSRLPGGFAAPLPVRVEQGELNDVLALALTVLGCRVSREGRGLPAFSVELGGFRLRAWDEEGEAISPDRLYVLLTKIEMERGAGRVALPAWAPAAADGVAARFGGQVLRLGRDREAWQLWKSSPWLWDGVYAACRVCARLACTGETLAHLDRELPRFATVRREVPLRDRRTQMLEALIAQYPGGYLEGLGARLPVGEGWINLTPFARRGALRVIAEAMDLETAAELCCGLEKKVLELDKKEEKRE